MISKVAYKWCAKALMISVFLFADDLFAQQNKEIDSLENLLGKLPGDTNKIKILIKLSRQYQNHSGQKSVDLAHDAIELSGQLHEETFLARSYQTLGMAYCIVGNQDSSIWAFEQTVVLAEGMKRYKMVSETYINMGIAYGQQSKYDKALKCYYKSLEIAEKNLINVRKESIYGNISNLYRDMHDVQAAAHFDTLTLLEADRRQANDNFKFLVLGNHAGTLRDLRKLKEARKLILECLEYHMKTGDKFYLSNHYETLGSIGFLEKKFDEASISYRKSLALKQEVGNLAGMAMIYERLAATEFARRQFNSAREFAAKAFGLSDSLKLREIKRDAAKVMMMIALFEKKLSDARYYDSLFVATQYDLNLQEQSRIVAELNAKYEYEKKEKENQLLKLNHLEQSAELARQRYTILLIGVILIAVTILLIVVYRSRYIFKKTNALLSTTNKAVQAQREEILIQKEQLAGQMLELKKTQSQLIQAEKMASLGQMTSGIAHEINNPLNFIAGGVEALKHPVERLISAAKGGSKLSPDEIIELEACTKRMAAVIDNGVRRVHGIITSLRTFSSPQGAITTVNITEILDMALTLLNNKIVDSQVIVVKNYDVGRPIVKGNSSELSQVFTNIIDNAIQAMTDTARVRQLTLGLAIDSENIAVTVADTGSGIAPEIQSKIMEPFFTTKGVGKGTGLGLSISYNIIKNHQGQIAFTSELYVGSKFTISLKIFDDSKEIDATSARA